VSSCVSGSNPVNLVFFSRLAPCLLDAAHHKPLLCPHRNRDFSHRIPVKTAPDGEFPASSVHLKELHLGVGLIDTHYPLDPTMSSSPPGDWVVEPETDGRRKCKAAFCILEIKVCYLRDGEVVQTAGNFTGPKIFIYLQIAKRPFPKSSKSRARGRPVELKIKNKNVADRLRVE